MTLADAATQRFLATKEVVVLATLQADGAPLAMPMWFLHDPSAITMISVDGLQKVKNLRRDPRVCVVAESADAHGIRGVTIQGRAEFLSDGPERRALVERLLRAGRNVRTSVSFGPAGAVAAALIVLFFVAQNVAPSFACLSSGR